MAQKTYDSLRGDYKTPPQIYKPLLLLAEVQKFDLDVCCSDENIPAEKYNYIFYVDGLKTDWSGKCFMNPPFFCTEKWVKKAVKEVKRNITTEVYCVLPADRFETKFYQENIIRNSHCMFAFLPGKQGFIVPGREKEPLKPSQKIAIVVFSRHAKQLAHNWNCVCLFNTLAICGAGGGLSEKFFKRNSESL